MHWEEFFLLFFILLIITFLVSYYVIYFNFSKKIKIIIGKTINLYSEAFIDVSDRKINFRSIAGFHNQSVKSFSLEEFIYMLSFNPESKNFREFLKLINNRSSIENINKKIKTLESSIPFIITYSNGEKTLSFANINKEKTLSNGGFYFQLTESAINKKSDFTNELFKKKIDYLNSNEIFLSLLTQERKITTKGFTLIKISSKSIKKPSTKGYFLNKLLLIKLSYLLENEKIKAFHYSDGSIYAITKSIKRTNYFSVQKNWKNIISSILNKESEKEYLNLNIDDLNIYVTSDTKKTQNSINEAIIRINLMSDFMIEKELEKDVDVNSLHNKARVVANEAEKLLDSIKSDVSLVVKNSIYNLDDEKNKRIVEFYIDHNVESMKLILDYSFKQQREILEGLIRYANNQASHFSNEIVTIMIDVSNISLFISIISKVSLQNNFYISLVENYSTINERTMWKQYGENLKNLKCKIIQIIRNEEEISLELTRAFKPKFILLYKKIYNENINEEINMSLRTLEINKDKDTKIIVFK